MILLFPDRTTLSLAMTSGVVPDEMLLAPANVAETDDGLLIETDADASSSARKKLRDLGVKGKRSMPDSHPVGSWLELLRLVPDANTLPGSGAGSEAASQRTPIVFDLPNPERLPEIVGEMLRLGNDRQGYRHVTAKSDSDADASPRALLRVVGPPFYTLLRALEHGAGADTPTAFREQSQRVWVELGFRHPLAEKITPPPGHWLFLRRPDKWEYVAEGRFQDIYETLEFELPEPEAPAVDVELEAKLEVPLSLTRGTSQPSTEIWVLTENAMRQLDELVGSASDKLLDRIAFAVAQGEDDDAPTVVLRVRPGKDAPPVLVLDATEFAPYLKLSNLFLPIGHRLQPPLRRDAVKQLLADDPRLVTWLMPEGARGFVPQSVADLAFRPLRDWVEYVLDVEQESLETWADSFRFNFDDFICPEEEEERRREREKRQKAEDEKEERRAAREERKAQAKQREKKKPTKARAETKQRAPSASKAEEETVVFEEVTIPEMQIRLSEVEDEFLSLELSPDAEERLPLWREMAELNVGLGKREDATICWTNLLWDNPNASEADVEDWFRSEWGAAFDAGSVDAPKAKQIDAVLGNSSPPPGQVTAVIAYLTWLTAAEPEGAHAANRDHIASDVGRLQAFLSRQEAALSLRTAWLGWSAAYELAGRDELMLARARDRMLERLYQTGISPDRELPGFLRASSMGGSSEKFRQVRDRILGLHERFEAWRKTQTGIVNNSYTRNVKNNRDSDYWTGHYVELVFAYAFARMGESHASEALHLQAHEAMLLDAKTSTRRRGQPKPDAVHHWAQLAYGFRVKEAAARKPLTGQLPEEILEAYAQLSKPDAYRLDYLRKHSQILEPHEEINAYRHFRSHGSDVLGGELADLFDISDRDELAQRIGELLTRTKREGDPEAVARVLKTGLELSPRIGEAFALQLLAEESILGAGDGPTTIELLERALHISAHFGQSVLVRQFVQQIESAFASFTQVDPNSTQGWTTFKAFEKLLFQAVKGLRKLGLRDEINALLDSMAEAVLLHYETDDDGLPTRPEGLQLLLTIASGWFYFGREDRCWPILNRAQEKLSQHLPISTADTQVRIPLACGYIHSVSQANVDDAMDRLEALFRVGAEGGGLLGISDHSTASTHYLISQIRVAEALALALVSEDFNLDQAGRIWLDDDEYRIRRRVHADVQQATGG